jgi:hypothetical protein
MNEVELVTYPGEYMAWWVWDGNLEYLCRQDTAYREHDKYLLPAWDSANGKGSYESNKLILKEV